MTQMFSYYNGEPTSATCREKDTWMFQEAKLYINGTELKAVKKVR